MTDVITVLLPPAAEDVITVLLAPAAAPGADDACTVLLPADGPVQTLLSVEGPAGARGVPGPGPVVLTYLLTAASSWFQQHAFAYAPAVRLVDGFGEQVHVGVAYPDAAHVNLVFPTPFTGAVILS